MRTNERRAEIMRILVSKRKLTISELSETLCVSARTIKRDVAVLMLEYPIFQISGIGGGLALPDWYHPYRNILSREQFQTLDEIKDQLSDKQKCEVIDGILSEYAANYYRD
ncbi:MAG: HTH domain-containing protein [Oscillospiraceae bacterium]|nr:HTH domain-containing protein [Oscillospiraceae bacterium]